MWSVQDDNSGVPGSPVVTITVEFPDELPKEVIKRVRTRLHAEKCVPVMYVGDGKIYEETIPCELC